MGTQRNRSPVIVRAEERTNMFRRNRFFYMLFTIIFLIVFIYFSLSFYSGKKEVILVSNKLLNDTKYILLWTELFSSETWYLEKNYLDSQDFARYKCPQTNCVLTTDRSLLQDASFYDAIVFHGTHSSSKLTSMPTIRNTYQHYVVNFGESPLNTQDHLDEYRNVFNWTMTYRLDSDVFSPYGFLKERQTGITIAPSIQPDWRTYNSNFTDSHLIELVKKKKGKIAWFVSNCDTSSNRMALTKRLQKYISVDVFGKCGKLKCPITDMEGCYRKLDDYKFYLSFENTLCDDYVTEKLFAPIRQFVIPIAFGGANYERFVPPKSIIDANGFPDVEKLANYLLYLDNNPEEYVKYFWWRQFYTVEREEAISRFCALCVKLHEPASLSKEQYYNDLKSWWFGGAENEICRTKPNIKI